MTERFTGRAGTVMRWVVSALALGLVAWWASRQRFAHVPTGGRAIAWFAAGLGVYAVATVLRAERWHRLLAHWGSTTGRGDALGTTLVGYMGNNLLPARAGDVLKATLAAGRGGLGAADAVGAAVAEKLLDALALVLLFAATAAVAVHGSTSHGLLAAGVLGAGAVVLALAIFVAARSQRLRTGPVTRTLATARELAGPRGVLLLCMSLGVWILEATVYFAVAQALGLGLQPIGAVYVVGITNLTALVPAGPGYIGTFDAAVLFGLRAVGVAAPVTYVVALRAVLFVPITVAGGVALATRYGGLPALRPRRLQTSGA